MNPGEHYNKPAADSARQNIRDTRVGLKDAAEAEAMKYLMEFLNKPRE